MAIERFMKKHRKELQEIVKSKLGINNYINTEEIRLWINNDEDLYL